VHKIANSSLFCSLGFLLYYMSEGRLKGRQSWVSLQKGGMPMDESSMRSSV